MKETVQFLTDNWEVITPIVYEVGARVIPTKHNLSLLDLIVKVVGMVLKNKRKPQPEDLQRKGYDNMNEVLVDRAKHIISVVLLFVSFLSYGQATNVYRGVIWANVDTTAFKNTVAVNDTYYGNIGAEMYNPVSNRFRLYYAHGWHNLATGGAAFSLANGSGTTVSGGNKLNWTGPLTVDTFIDGGGIRNVELANMSTYNFATASGASLNMISPNEVILYPDASFLRYARYTPSVSEVVYGGVTHTSNLHTDTVSVQMAALSPGISHTLRVQSNGIDVLTSGSAQATIKAANFAGAGLPLYIAGGLATTGNNNGGALNLYGGTQIGAADRGLVNVRGGGVFIKTPVGSPGGGTMADNCIEINKAALGGDPIWSGFYVNGQGGSEKTGIRTYDTLSAVPFFPAGSHFEATINVARTRSVAADGTYVDLTIAAGSSVFEDGRAVPLGLQYGADYSATYTNRSIIDKGYFAGSHLIGSAVLNFPSTLTATCNNLTISVTGAADGDPVALGVPAAAVPAGGSFTAWVSSANNVSVRYCNNTAGSLDPASATFKVSVTKY
jgi:hypothetical protein